MSEHYYTAYPTSESRTRAFSVQIRGVDLRFHTDSGLFSKAALDEGTRILIEFLPELTGHVLDMGCGWGAIGTAIAAAMPQTLVTMTDINERAVSLARTNLTLNHVTADVFCGDGFLPVAGRAFSAVVMNPPIRAGKEVMYGLFREARSYLIPGGSLYLVIRKKQGADSAFRFLNGVFQSVRVMKKSGGYAVIEAATAP